MPCSLLRFCSVLAPRVIARKGPEKGERCDSREQKVALLQPSHLTEAKALRPRARLNLPAAFLPILQPDQVVDLFLCTL